MPPGWALGYLSTGQVRRYAAIRQGTGNSAVTWLEASAKVKGASAKVRGFRQHDNGPLEA